MDNFYYIWLQFQPIFLPMKKNYYRIPLLIAAFLLLILSNSISQNIIQKKVVITPPQLTNSPSFDVICTNNKPLLSFFNSSGGIGNLVYTIQIASTRNFRNIYTEYTNIRQKNSYITTKFIEDADRLPIDKQYYYWRVKAIDTQGNESNWATSRFYLDTTSDDKFMGLVRVNVESVKVSGGANSENIIDISDIGNTTHWEPPPPATNATPWVIFNLSEQKMISRIWMLSDPSGKEGWLTDFYWMSSLDGNNWSVIDGTVTKNNHTFRNIIDFPAVSAKYLKLVIKDFEGYAPQLFASIFYSKGEPTPPTVPNEDYVLIVGDQLNGFTFTNLAEYVQSLNLNLKTVTIPHYEVSLAIVESLNPQPVAIIFSGNNADYPNLPMFEFNGGYEIVRNSNLPILGICAGHQLEAMAFGYTYAHSTGWFDNTIIDLEQDVVPDSITIVKDIPIFKNIPSPFFGVEIHSWATDEATFSDIGFEVTAKSSYVQAQKIKSRMVFGEQFHAEVDVVENQGKPMIFNFLSMAIKNAKIK